VSEYQKSFKKESVRGSLPYGYYHITRVQGASHLKHNKPCQDAFAFLNCEKDDEPFILSIADGHGDQKYDMSEYGSKLATETAVKILKELYEKLKHSKTALFRSFRDDFPKDLIREWRKCVLQHAQENGLKTDHSTKVYTRYGTTLLVALVSKDEILFGQIGDGDLLVINHNGEYIVPLLEEEELIGNETYSLTSTEAHLFWKASRMDYPEGQTWLMLSTDGLSNCFEDDVNFHRFANSLFNYINESSFSLIEDQLPSVLFDYSDKGSGDDITAAVLQLKSSQPSRDVKVTEKKSVGKEKNKNLHSDLTFETKPIEQFYSTKQGSNILKPLKGNSWFQGETIIEAEETNRKHAYHPPVLNFTFKSQRQDEKISSWLESKDKEERESE
jgi:serine/threonine protein phosphatase PrpC